MGVDYVIDMITSCGREVNLVEQKQRRQRDVKGPEQILWRGIAQIVHVKLHLHFSDRIMKYICM